MKAGGVLNQPSGQLLLAAATVNELINISLITEIDAIVANGPWHTFVPWLLTVVINSICGMCENQGSPYSVSWLDLSIAVCGKVDMPHIKCRNRVRYSG